MNELYKLKINDYHSLIFLNPLLWKKVPSTTMFKEKTSVISPFITGSGAYGTVLKYRHKKTDDLVAVKKVKFELESEGFPSTSIREISLLK